MRVYQHLFYYNYCFYSTFFFIVEIQINAPPHKDVWRASTNQMQRSLSTNGREAR